MPINMIARPMAMMREGPPDPSMTVEGFKECLLKKFDANHDGRISKHELREALRRHGGGRWLAAWRCGRAVHHADTNRNGFVDDAEIENLVAFARKEMGLRISTW
ncbi:putative calcium-binding protein CML44 [Panicum miliaceum]|uniref:Calcium-binding protein CML44 n=1 Tax=Panicum miliaceum TaxID=4540 RepID=A0A3L6QSQ1_PANMI|nr:putative calcium-binding protein CML44 [Panicum miliaceum]